MKYIQILAIVTLTMAISYTSFSQELYVYSDPASNVPAKSLALKYGGKWIKDTYQGHEHIATRQMLESSMGVSKKLMIRPSLTFSNMYSLYPDLAVKFESASIYAKYRFISIDDIHKHFRAAAYVKGVLSRNELQYDELTIDGDQSALQFGLIFTQLVNKLAVSANLGIHQVMDDERWLKYAGPRNFGYQAFNYILSGGYLVYPKKYTSYEQTNFNIYFELIGGQGLDRTYSFVDFAPAVQLIFNSNTKVNLGYRFQVSGDVYRMARQGVYLSAERTFLNVLKKRS
ncbi:MAG: hypothetical protein RL131_1210 [Bacteroidota bacterium]